MTLIKTPCKGGSLAGLTFDNPDCPDCRGIKNITQSADKTTLTVYYTDGTSQQFVLPVGTGIPGIPGQTGPGGTSLLYNNFAGTSTTSISTFETLDTAPVLANTVPTDFDALEFQAIFHCAAPDVVNQQGYELTLNGQLVIGALFMPGFGASRVVVTGTINRLTNTTATAICTVQQFPQGGGQAQSPAGNFIVPITTLDFTTTMNLLARAFNAPATAVVTSDWLFLKYDKHI